MKRLLALLLSVLTVTSVIAGCAASPEAKSNSVTETNAVADAETTTDDGLYHDELPSNDYEGFSYNFYTRENTTHYRVLVEEQNGEVLNDAIFVRNSNVAERYNVVFTETTYSDETMARTVVMAGEDAYSIMNVRCSAANTLAMEALVYGINSLPYVDLDKGYWDRELIEALSVGGKEYFAIGDMNLSTFDFMSVMLFNKQLLADMGLESPYALVEQDKWTMDKFGELGAQASTDINGDGKMNASDTFGSLGPAKYLHVSLLTGGDTMMIKLIDGYPRYEMGTDEHMINVFDKVFEVTVDNGSWYKTTDESNESTAYINMFRANQGLFITIILYYVENMRDMETEFGIIPYPKYDENQERYRNRITFYDTFVVPITATDLERTSIIIEALQCESGNVVVPAYYDIALKSKYTRDDESQVMLDIIMDNRVLDLGDTVYVGLIRDSWLAKMFINDTRDLVSTASKYTKSINKQLDTMIAKYDALDY